MKMIFNELNFVSGFIKLGIQCIYIQKYGIVQLFLKFGKIFPWHLKFVFLYLD